MTAGLCLAGVAWSLDGVRAAVASVLVYASGMVLNDHADRHVDARTRPERPLPAGQIGPYFALTLGLALMIGGVLVSPCIPYYAAMAVAVLAYDYVLKASPAAGALVMGGLRAANLCAGAVAVTASPPDTTLLIAASAYGLYIVAVTVLGILEDEEQPEPRVVRSVQLVAPLCAALAMLAMPERWPAVLLGFTLASAFVARAVRVKTWDRAAIRGSMTWLLLGTMLYTGLLCLAAGRWLEAVAVWAAVIPAKLISRWIALT